MLVFVEGGLASTETAKQRSRLFTSRQAFRRSIFFCCRMTYLGIAIWPSGNPEPRLAAPVFFMRKLFRQVSDVCYCIEGINENVVVG